jgi:hypothetical protein
MFRHSDEPQSSSKMHVSFNLWDAVGSGNLHAHSCFIHCFCMSTFVSKINVKVTQRCLLPS